MKQYKINNQIRVVKEIKNIFETYFYIINNQYKINNHNSRVSKQ
jgi:hypothetical protein